MRADLIKAGYEGEGDECDFPWVTLSLEGSLVGSNLHPCKQVESVDREHESPCVRQLDSLIGCG
jgi:hypothetical protein